MVLKTPVFVKKLKISSGLDKTILFKISLACGTFFLKEFMERF